MDSMIFFAWIYNHTDRRDDDVLKIEASDRQIAINHALRWASSRGGCSLGMVYSRKEFKEEHPEWHTLLWGDKAEKAYDYSR